MSRKLSLIGVLAGALLISPVATPGTVMVVMDTTGTAIMAATDMVMVVMVTTGTDIMGATGMVIATTMKMAIGIGTIITTGTAAGGAATGMATASATVGNGPRTATGGCATRRAQ